MTKDGRCASQQWLSTLCKAPGQSMCIREEADFKSNKRYSVMKGFQGVPSVRLMGNHVLDMTGASNLLLGSLTELGGVPLELTMRDSMPVQARLAQAPQSGSLDQRTNCWSKERSRLLWSQLI